MKKNVLILIALLLFSINGFADVDPLSDPVLVPKLQRETKDYINNVTQQIEDLKNTVADDFANDFVNYCTIIICLGAIFHVGMKIIKSLQKGNLLDLNTLILPFLFIFVIGIYRPATQFVDYTTAGFQYFIASKCDNLDSELNQLRDEKVRIQREINQKIYERELEEASGWWEEYWAKFKKFMKDEIISKANPDYWLAYFFILLLYISAFLIRIMGGGIAIILYIIGPFCISISIFPILKDVWKTWLSTYIWCQLFSPVAQIISYVLGILEKNSLSMDISRLQLIYTNYAEHLSTPVPETFYSGMTYIAFMFSGIVMFWAVPTIASWLVPAQGNGVISALSAFASKTFASAAMKSKRILH